MYLDISSIVHKKNEEISNDVVEVIIGNGGAEVVSIFIHVLGKHNLSSARLYVSCTYNAAIQTSIDNYDTNILKFEVTEINGWSLSAMAIYRVIGYSYKIRCGKGMQDK